MSLLGAWLVPGGCTVFCQLSLPGWAWPLAGCGSLLAGWAVGVGEPVGCFGIHLAVIRQPTASAGRGTFPALAWDKVVPSAVEVRPDGGNTTKGLRSGF